MHKDLYLKLIQCFSKFIPLIITQYILNEKDRNLLIGEIVNDTNSDKSETEIEIYESKEDLR